MTRNNASKVRVFIVNQLPYWEPYHDPGFRLRHVVLLSLALVQTN